MLSRSTPTIGFEHLPSTIAAKIQYEIPDELEDTTVDPEPRAANDDGTSTGVVREPFAAGPTTRVRRPAPTREELVAALTACNGSVAQVARAPRPPVRGGLAHHPALRDRRRQLPQERSGVMGIATIVLRPGARARSGFGHPWVYANAVLRGRRPGGGRPRRAQRSRRTVHRPGILQPALADPRASSAPASTSRSTPVSFARDPSRARRACSPPGLPSERSPTFID